MPKTKIVESEPISENEDLCSKYWCDNGDRWDFFTMITGLLMLIMGLCCSTIEVGYIIYTYRIQCYCVGLWCSAGFLLIGTLAMGLYHYESVPSASLMLFCVMCDLIFGIVMPLIAIAFTIKCGKLNVFYYPITMICILVGLISIVHIFFVTRELLKLRRQFYREG
ncbi:uncharacterized protein DC041_0004325 [Schistosoma bovis]|uniref:Uncharacterized protein n=1 Tax=Schistosoma bovis TaxID=6184 RepID=A0A430QRW3_SCHBO|nr:uncharacterized protein DC041_0004325 [Schistosoma bovis]CAH8468830.1 unnamed protein product [Schistosoma bovis]